MTTEYRVTRVESQGNGVARIHELSGYLPLGWNVGGSEVLSTYLGATSGCHRL